MAGPVAPRARAGAALGSRPGPDDARATIAQVPKGQTPSQMWT